MFYSCTTCCHPWFSKHITSVIMPFPIKAGGLKCSPDHTQQTPKSFHKRWKAYFFSSYSQTNCLGKTWVFCFCLFRISDRLVTEREVLELLAHICYHSYSQKPEGPPNPTASGLLAAFQSLSNHEASFCCPWTVVGFLRCHGENNLLRPPQDWVSWKVLWLM